MSPLMLPLLSLACSQKPPETLTIVAPAELDEALTVFVHQLDDPRVLLETGEDGAAAGELAQGLVVTVTLGDRCPECYILRADGLELQVEGGGLLGAQYGLAHLLERLGYRFPHPFSTRVPATLPAGLDAEDPALVRDYAPEMALRGIHLHTLHPIEGLFGFWVEPPAGLGEGEDFTVQGRTEAVIDWVVKNRGNHLQWVSLDDIEEDPELHADWKERTTAINEAAHARGLSTGLGIQLFGSGNLQQAFDLLDDPSDVKGWDAAFAERLGLVTGAGFDIYDLSFGEFFGEEPETFLAAVNGAYAALQEAEEGAQMSAVVHVGDSEDQHVTYKGEDLIYYMLVKYADPGIIPHVHSVMFYNLYADAGGAYHHEDFSEHRQMILDELQAGQRVAYFPETAYWVAFDDSVPQYLPLYVRSRHRDLAGLRAEADTLGIDRLQEHVLFSTGWEWGYWQNDVMSLRMSYALPEDWGDLYRDWWAVEGDDGRDLAESIVALAEAQQRAHIEGRAAAYLASRDAVMDVGYAAGIVAAPDRIELAVLASLPEAEQQAFADGTLAVLASYEAEVAAVYQQLVLNPVLGRDPFAVEVRDGVEIDLLRARFVLALYRAVLAPDPAEQLALADAALLQATAVVARRHADLHDPLGATLVDPAVPNPTIYDYGYLARADELCFWQRERVLAARALEGSTEAIPACI